MHSDQKDRLSLLLDLSILDGGEIVMKRVSGAADHILQRLIMRLTTLSRVDNPQILFEFLAFYHAAHHLHAK